MALSDVFLTLGQDGFGQLIRSVSLGKLKTYQLYDRIKTRTHLAKLNAESLQKASPRLWTRLSEKDEEFAQDLSQAVLVCHLDMSLKQRIGVQRGRPSLDVFACVIGSLRRWSKSAAISATWTERTRNDDIRPAGIRYPL